MSRATRALFTVSAIVAGVLAGLALKLVIEAGVASYWLVLGIVLAALGTAVLAAVVLRPGRRR